MGAQCSTAESFCDDGICFSGEVAIGPEVVIQTKAVAQRERVHSSISTSSKCSPRRDRTASDVTRTSIHSDNSGDGEAPPPPPAPVFDIVQEELTRSSSTKTEEDVLLTKALRKKKNWEVKIYSLGKPPHEVPAVDLSIAPPIPPLPPLSPLHHGKFKNKSVPQLDDLSCVDDLLSPGNSEDCLSSSRTDYWKARIENVSGNLDESFVCPRSTSIDMKTFSPPLTNDPIPINNNIELMLQAGQSMYGGASKTTMDDTSYTHKIQNLAVGN